MESQGGGGAGRGAWSGPGRTPDPWGTEAPWLRAWSWGQGEGQTPAPAALPPQQGAGTPTHPPTTPDQHSLQSQGLTSGTPPSLHCSYPCNITLQHKQRNFYLKNKTNQPKYNTATESVNFPCTSVTYWSKYRRKGYRGIL